MHAGLEIHRTGEAFALGDFLDLLVGSCSERIRRALYGERATQFRREHRLSKVLSLTPILTFGTRAVVV